MRLQLPGRVPVWGHGGDHKMKKTHVKSRLTWLSEGRGRGCEL